MALGEHPPCMHRVHITPALSQHDGQSACCIVVHCVLNATTATVCATCCHHAARNNPIQVDRHDIAYSRLHMPQLLVRKGRCVACPQCWLLLSTRVLPGLTKCASYGSQTCWHPCVLQRNACNIYQTMTAALTQDLDKHAQHVVHKHVQLPTDTAGVTLDTSVLLQCLVFLIRMNVNSQQQAGTSTLTS